MRKILIIIFVIGLSIKVKAQTEIFGLATPIQLGNDTTVVYLEDYFTDVTHIQEIGVPDCLNFNLSPDKKILMLTQAYDTTMLVIPPEPDVSYKMLLQPRQIPFLSELKITAGGEEYSILLRKSKKEKVHFSWHPNGVNYSKVSIVGEMTGWNPNIQFMQYENGVWSTDLILNPGRYQYQIVADGKWFLDPNNQDSIDNGIGGYNSLLKVRSYDFLGLYNQADHSHGDTISFNLLGGFDGFTEKDKPNTHVFSYWENQTVKCFIDSSFEWHLIIPEEAKKIRRSFIRVYAYAKTPTYFPSFDTVAEGEYNDLLIPLEYGKIITDPSLLSKDDLQKTIIYFMMVDRFNNGDKTNDNPVKDDRVLPQANYYGGDLAGIKQKIDDGYFDKLGINALWISPVFQNPYNAYQEFPEPHRWFSGYHGYWPISLSQVDTRFGSNAIFKNLIDDAHNDSISVFLDYVANHIHEQHPLWTQHPEWFSQLNLPDGRKNLRLWDEYRLTTWFEPYMPSFDHSNPIVAEACADSAMWWLEEFHLDGFRHDATKHIETEFWRLLTEKIKTEVEIPQNRNIYQIGETFGSRELINSYIGSGLLNAQFDFNLYFDERSVFVIDDVSFERLATSLNETFDYFGYHHLMGNISGNQDMARFISYASGDLKFSENDKEVGWQRHIDVTDTIGYAKLKMLQAFNMTIPGIPIIYYGDEIGLPGANDPDNRRMMQFDSLNKYQLDVRNTVSKLTKLRSEHMALLYGDFTILEASPGIFIYMRKYFDDLVIVGFNKTDMAFGNIVELPDDVNGTPIAMNSKNKVEFKYRTLNMMIKPYSFEIITFEK